MQPNGSPPGTAAPSTAPRPSQLSSPIHHLSPEMGLGHSSHPDPMLGSLINSARTEFLLSKGSWRKGRERIEHICLNAWESLGQEKEGRL